MAVNTSNGSDFQLLEQLDSFGRRLVPSCKQICTMIRRFNLREVRVLLKLRNSSFEILTHWVDTRSSTIPFMFIVSTGNCHTLLQDLLKSIYWLLKLLAIIFVGWRPFLLSKRGLGFCNPPSAPKSIFSSFLLVFPSLSIPVSLYL